MDPTVPMLAAEGTIAPVSSRIALTAETESERRPLWRTCCDSPLRLGNLEADDY